MTLTNIIARAACYYAIAMQRGVCRIVRNFTPSPYKLIFVNAPQLRYFKIIINRTEITAFFVCIFKYMNIKHIKRNALKVCNKICHKMWEYAHCQRR